MESAAESNRDRELGHNKNGQVERAGDMILESKDTKTGRLGGGVVWLTWNSNHDVHSCRGEKAEQKWTWLQGTYWVCGG